MILILGKMLPLSLLFVVGPLRIHGTVSSRFRCRAARASARRRCCPVCLCGFENTRRRPASTEPSGDIPFALIVTMLVTAIYTLIQLIALGAVPGLGSEDPARPGDGACSPVGGHLAPHRRRRLSILGTLNNAILCGGRYLYRALAARGFASRACSPLVHPAAPHSMDRAPHPPPGHRGATRAQRHLRRDRGAVGHRAHGELHRDRRRRAGPPPQAAREGADDSIAGRARRSRSLPSRCACCCSHQRPHRISSRPPRR